MAKNLYDRWVVPRVTHLACRAGVLREYRRRLAGEACGAVLEIGFGSGHNLEFLDPSRVTRVWALEPDAKLLELAAPAIARAPFPVEMLNTGAECIPLPDASVDTALSAWTMCTIADVEQALRELRRVLKPAGRLLYVEHGLAPSPGIARWQHRLTPLWRRCAGGCHLDRDPQALLRQAGFVQQSSDQGYLRPHLGPGKLVAYMYEGSAGT